MGDFQPLESAEAPFEVRPHSFGEWNSLLTRDVNSLQEISEEDEVRAPPAGDANGAVTQVRATRALLLAHPQVNTVLPALT